MLILSVLFIGRRGRIFTAGRQFTSTCRDRQFATLLAHPGLRGQSNMNQVLAVVFELVDRLENIVERDMGAFFDKSGEELRFP